MNQEALSSVLCRNRVYLLEQQERRRHLGKSRSRVCRHRQRIWMYAASDVCAADNTFGGRRGFSAVNHLWRVPAKKLGFMVYEVVAPV